MVGDYFDFVIEEVDRAFDFYSKGDGWAKKALSAAFKLFSKFFITGLLHVIRNLSAEEKRSSSSKGVCVVIRNENR